MSESYGDHEEAPTAPSEGANAQNTPGVEVIEVATGNSVAVYHAKALFTRSREGGEQEVYDVPSKNHKVGP